MEAGTLASMYAQIVRGVAKEDSRFVTDDASSAKWDNIAAQVEQARREIPGVVFSIPNEMPDPDEGPDAGAPPEGAPAEPGAPADATVGAPDAQTGATDGQGAPPGDQSGGTTPPQDNGGQA